MEHLLERYNITDIIVFIVLLAAAFKGVVDFIIWGKNNIKKVLDKEHANRTNANNINNKISANEERIKKLEENQIEINKTLQKLNNKIDILVESDKDDIKSFLTRNHHYYCYTQKWIDDFTLDCCEKRYRHYKDEGGNSFISGFMDDLRSLPKMPPGTSDSNQEQNNIINQ